MSKTIALKPDHDSEAGSKAPTSPRKEIVLPMNQLKLYEQSNLIHRAVSKDATREDILNPAFWAVAQGRLKSFDLVMVVTQTHAYMVWVLHSQLGMPVMVEILKAVAIPVVPELAHATVPQGYAIRFSAEDQKYQGVRERSEERDEVVMTAKHARWVDAFSELMNHACFRH